MGAVLLAGPDRDEQARVTIEIVADLLGEERFQVQRPVHSVIVAGTAATVAATEWLHSSSPGWAWVAGGAALVAAVAAIASRPIRGRLGAAGVAAMLVGVAVTWSAWSAGRLRCCWPDERERRVRIATQALTETLSGAVTEARRLAERGATAALRPPADAFDRLATALEGGHAGAGLERGVAILEADGRPVAWAGRHRTPPGIDSTELRVSISAFYATLEARRQAPNGRWAVGRVLLEAAPVIADADRTLAAQFGRAHGVQLRFQPLAGTSASLERVAFCSAACGSRDTLAMVDIVPPSQGDAMLATLAGAANQTGLALALLFGCLLLAAPPGRWRWLVIGGGVWLLARDSFGPASPGSVFSPATFYRSALGDFGDSVGSFGAVGLAALVAAAAVWRRGVRRRRWQVALAGALIIYAPYLVRYFGQGIAPPAGGVSFGLWLSWEVTIAAAAMAILVIAAALVRGESAPARTPWTVPFAGLWAMAVGVLGLWLWAPYNAWPEWYTFLWLPALAGVVTPAPRRAMLLGIATVAGTAAALVTWGAAVEGRLALAIRDAQRLGHRADAVTQAELERLGADLAGTPAPRSAGELYAIWERTALAAEQFPADLAVWSPPPRSERLLDLPLATLDLPPALLAALARSDSFPGGNARFERMERVPGTLSVLIVRLAGGARLTVGVGPRSRVIAQSRVARFLGGEGSVAPPYTVSLSLPTPGSMPPGDQPFWTREGWTVRGERHIDLPGGPRHVHVNVDLQGPWGLLVRGALVVLVDAFLLFGAWGLCRLVGEGWSLDWRAAVDVIRASYRAQLTTVLAAFFVIPVLVFAGGTVARLAEGARQTSDLLIGQTLRDAAATASDAAGFVTPASRAATAAVADLGERIDAELWLYRGGALEGTSAPILAELGLVDAFLSPGVYRRLAFQDELAAAGNGVIADRPIRLGFRVVGAGSPREQLVLAAPQLLDDERVREQRQDLALIALLATALGLVAAGVLAGLAARPLTEPVAVLRDAALAVGQGATPAPFPARPPREFQPVMHAFERMVSDIQESQAALEEARRRTAEVLANVATGVIAVDEELRISMANPRAAELCGTALPAGTLLTDAGGAEWRPVWATVRTFVAERSVTIVEREFVVAGGTRQIRAQFAPLGPSPAGCVVALDDTTALARASRVLAWGEMARQVAHEIKNPLTPIRLGIQSLQRARAARASGKRGAGRGTDFDRVLEETSGRILAEIDRLDAIARAFSRFGAPASGAAELPLEAVDLHAAAAEVTHLYALGAVEGGTRVGLEGTAGGVALARRDEVKEVLINLIENARNAGAHRAAVRVSSDGLTLTVADDGGGIPEAALGRVFEPAFTTTSSGAGLGLAIVKRLVESWGGRISLASVPGRGTTVTITLQGGERAGAG